MGVPKFPFLMEIRSNHAFTMLLAAYVTFTAHSPNKSKSIRHFTSEFRNRTCALLNIFDSDFFFFQETGFLLRPDFFVEMPNSERLYKGLL
jgi:hypothetical protein